MPRLNDPNFWQPYLPAMRREFADVTMDILIAGGDAGAADTRLSTLIDWDVFNEDALAWLDMYLGTGTAPGMGQAAYAWAWSLNETTRRAVLRELDRWVRSGAPLPELEARLGLLFDAKRARRIAATEVTRIYASGNVMAWRASGVVSGKVWQTARDELVCPVCGRLHNTLVDLDGGWEFSAATLAANPALARAVRTPMTVMLPPAHVACILPGNKVIVPGKLSAAAQSFYHGKAVEIVVSSGRVLTVTQNHPILTPVGYIAAGRLRKGDYVISTGRADGIATAVNPDDDHIPTAIEEVFRALKESPGVVAARVPAAAEDFHGDGRTINGDVNVVHVVGTLERDIESAFGQQLGQVSFGGHNVGLPGFSRPGRLLPFFYRHDTAAGGVIRGGNLLPPLFIGHERPFQEFGLRTAARFNTGLEQTSTDCPTVDAQTVGNGLFGFTGKVTGDNMSSVNIDADISHISKDTGSFQEPGHSLERHAFLSRQFTRRFSAQMSPDEIVSIREFYFSGHVYDLQVDDYELYITEGIITSNCRCWLKPVVYEAMTPAEIEAARFNPMGVTNA